MSLSHAFKKKAVAFLGSTHHRQKWILLPAAGLSLGMLVTLMCMDTNAEFPDVKDKKAHDQSLQSLKTSVTDAALAQKKADAYGVILSLKDSPGLSINREASKKAKKVFDLNAKTAQKKAVITLMHAKNISNEDFIALSKELSQQTTLAASAPSNILKADPHFVSKCQPQISANAQKNHSLQSAKDISLCTEEKYLRTQFIRSAIFVPLLVYYLSLLTFDTFFMDRWKKQIEAEEKRLEQEKTLTEQKQREAETLKKQEQEKAIAGSIFLKEDITVPKLQLKKPPKPEN